MENFIDVRSGYKFCMKMGNECSNDMVKNGIYEYNLIKWCEQFVSANGTFIDIGAHIGTYSVILSKKCKRVYSFEPQKDTFHCLNMSLNNNDCSNVISHNVGLSSTEIDSATLYHVSEDGGGSTLKHDVPMEIINSESITIKTLDSFDIENIDFIKIDVEGHELEVIKGAVNTLKNNNYPPFIFEAWHDEWYRQDRDILIRYVKELGYKVVLISGTNNMYLACDHEVRQNLKEKSLEAWEVLYNRSHQHRLNKEYNESYNCAMQSLCLIPPVDKQYLLHEEISIVAYYIDMKEIGYESCDKVIFSNAPWSVKNNTLSNQGYYMKSLPIKKSINIECNSSILKEFKESSTSIIATEDGNYRCNVRLVNYSINADGGYDIRDPNNIVRSRNILLTLDKDFNTNNIVEVRDKSNVAVYPKNILGIEDIRLFGNNEFLCTYLEVNKECIPQICYGRYCPITGDVTKILPLMLGTELKCEKNWMPFIQDDEVYFLYTVFPLHVCKLNRDTGEISTVMIVKSDEGCDFRGSGGLIPYKEGWLGTVHQVHYNNPRKYFHRFIWFSKDFLTIKFSDAFYFRSIGIEYNLSICHSKDGLLIPYSEKDNNSKIVILDYKVLDEYLWRNS